ncbi:MAG: mechanosensitive ion channel [Candidatus Nanohaloarchaea archaeon]
MIRELATLAGYRILTALAFVIFASIAIKIVSRSLRKIFERKYSEDTIVNLLESLSKGLMWFSAVLIILSILGFSEIAAALGTATGFIALGISFALKDVLADTVAGIYLAKDQDFNNGDQVKVDGQEGEIIDVGLRKSRLKLESGNTLVLNNSDVEKKWTLFNR